MTRDLDFGATFSRVVDLYTKHAAQLLMWSGIVAAVVSVAQAAIATRPTSSAATLVGIVALIIGLVGQFVLSGAYVIGIDEADTTGRFPAFGDVWARTSPRLTALLGSSLLAGLLIFVSLITIIGPAILGTWWCLLAPVVMLEMLAGMDALKRSREIVRGNAWTVFFLLVVVNLVAGIAAGIIGAIIGAVLGGTGAFLGAFASNFITSTLVMPVGALLAVVIYHTLVGRAESGNAPGTPPAYAPTPQHPVQQQPPQVSPTTPPTGYEPPPSQQGPFQ